MSLESVCQHLDSQEPWNSRGAPRQVERNAADAFCGSQAPCAKGPQQQLSGANNNRYLTMRVTILYFYVSKLLNMHDYSQVSHALTMSDCMPSGYRCYSFFSMSYINTDFQIRSHLCRGLEDHQHAGLWSKEIPAVN